MNSILEDILDMVEDIAEISREKIKPDSSMIEDLDLTSLEIMSIIAEIESKYSVKFSEEEMLNISTVRELVEAINSKAKL